MAETFFDQFVQSQGQPIAYRDSLVHLSYRMPVSKGSKFRIRLLSFAQSPVQGLRVKGRGCVLSAVGQRGKQFVVWSDVAPESTEFEVRSTKGTAEVFFVNVWKDPRYGSTFQGMNNAGMLVDVGDGMISLRCSDGLGPPDFAALVLRIEEVA